MIGPLDSAELARLLSEQAHALAWEQREAFIAETERQDIERAELARRRLERKDPKRGGPVNTKVRSTP